MHEKSKLRVSAHRHALEIAFALWVAKAVEGKFDIGCLMSYSVSSGKGSKKAMGSMGEDPLGGANYANTVIVEYFIFIAKFALNAPACW